MVLKKYPCINTFDNLNLDIRFILKRVKSETTKVRKLLQETDSEQVKGQTVTAA